MLDALVGILGSERFGLKYETAIMANDYAR